MAKVNVRLLDVVAGDSGKYYGIDFEMIGVPKLSADKSSFKGVSLIACGIDDKLVESLVATGKLDVLSDKEVDMLKAKLVPQTA